jgi:hypothetical protein
MYVDWDHARAGRALCVPGHTAGVSAVTDIAPVSTHDRNMYLSSVSPDLAPALGAGAARVATRSRVADIAWRPMPSVWWPWMCQLLVADTSPTWIELDLVASTPIRVRGTSVEPRTPFTIRAQRHRADVELVEAWARDTAMVSVLAGRDGRSSWMYLGVGRQCTLLHGVVGTLITRL